MTPQRPSRRILCAALTLAAATILFRGPLAAAVVTRGDEAFRSGDAATAIRSYRKALAIDPNSAVAADRLAFQLALVHRPGPAAAAIAVATAALQHNAADPALLVDRAFGELQLHEREAARADFARAGSLAGDSRYRALAARLARSGR